MMTIEDVRRAIEHDAALQALIPDTSAIAAILSGRSHEKVKTEIGVGLILETIGITNGNTLLDAIKNTPDFRYVYPLLEQGRLDLSSPLVEMALTGFVQAGVISTSDMNALIGLCMKPVEVSETLVKQAIWHDDGSFAIDIEG